MKGIFICVGEAARLCEAMGYEHDSITAEDGTLTGYAIEKIEEAFRDQALLEKYKERIHDVVGMLSTHSIEN
jgi:hypothetical protein